MMDFGWFIGLTVVVMLGVWLAMLIVVGVNPDAGNFAFFIWVISTGVACGAVIAIVLVALPRGLPTVALPRGLPPAENLGNFKPWYYILISLPATVILLWGLLHPSKWYARINVLGVRVPVHGGLKSLVYIIGIAFFGMLGTMGILGLFDDKFIRYADNVTSALLKSAKVYGAIGALLLGSILFCIGAWAAYDLLNKREAITTGDLVEMSIFMLLMGAFVVGSLLYLF